jgi:acyl-CoA synthetase (AMP-forming)/AMP-acid ligase II
MPATVLDMLDRGAPEAPAVVVPGGPNLTYRVLSEEVERAAATLAAMGVRREDSVGLVFENGPEAVVAFLAAAAVARAAPLNPAYTEAEFAFYLADVGARVLLVPPGAAGAARRALPDGGVVVEAAVDAGGRLRLDLDRAAGAPPPSAAPAPAGDDVALVLHTSGTTGRPKQVPLRHRHLAASVRNIAAAYGLGPDDVALCMMPLFHVHGLLASALSTLVSGGTVVVPAPFNPFTFWQVVRDHRPTWWSAVPTMHRMVLSRARHEPRPGGDALRFVRSCSSPLAPELMAELEDRLGVPVLEAYGMTEACHQISSNLPPPATRRPGTVGVGTGVEVGVLDEAGVVRPHGGGEVVVRGPNVIDGYAGDPAVNAEAFVHGWFRTGDQGELAGDGSLTLVGRIKEMINRGGEKVSPREVDEVLLRHPAVAEAVAFGVPHARLGEDVAAAVVLRNPASERELLDHCRAQLAAFKVPAVLHLVDEIPKTATGKVQRRKVGEAIGWRR